MRVELGQIFRQNPQFIVAPARADGLNRKTHGVFVVYLEARHKTRKTPKPDLWCSNRAQFEPRNRSSRPDKKSIEFRVAAEKRAFPVLR